MSTYLTRALLTAAIFVGLTACAPIVGSVSGSGNRSLSNQLSGLSRIEKASPQSRLIFIGAALDSKSQAFDGDVQAMDHVLARQYGNSYTSILLSNKIITSGARDMPLATIDNIDDVMDEVVKNKRPSDRYIMLLSSHGSKDYLSVEQEPRYKSARFLMYKKVHKWVEQLSPNRTWLIVSACHSGAVLNDMPKSQIVVMTASDRDNTSFGCNPGNDNTWFIAALLKSLDFDKSFSDVWKATTYQISDEEQTAELHASNPQLFISSDLGDILNGKISRF